MLKGGIAVSDKMQNTQEAEQTKTAEESEQTPPAVKKPATRKKASAPKAEPSNEGKTGTTSRSRSTAARKSVAKTTSEQTEAAESEAPAEKKTTTRKPSAKKTTAQAEKSGAATPRKRSAGTKKASAKKDAEVQADMPTEAAAQVPTSEAEPPVKQESTVEESVVQEPLQEEQVKQEPVVQAPPKQEPEKQEDVAKEASKEEPVKSTFFKQEAALPVVDLKDKTPVKTQTQRGVEVAVPLVNFAALNEQRRHFWGRVFLLLSVGVILALSIFIFLYRPTVYSAHSHSIRFLYNMDTDTTQVLYDGTLCKQTLQGEWTQSSYDSSGSICAAAIGGKLYLVQGNDVEEISPDVQDFMLSQNGRTLVYRTSENQLLYVRISGNRERYTVSRDCRDPRYCLSPDGELLFYTYAEQKQEQIKTHAALFSLSGMKPYFPQTTEIVPLAISNDFEHIFYFDEVGDLYHMNEKSEISLCRRHAEGGMEILFDREFEEVLIKDANGIMLWQDGEETMIPQLRGAQDLTILPNRRVIFRELPTGTQCLINSFDKNYYLKKGSEAEGTRLVYLSGETLNEGAFLSEEESHPVVTDKGVYYLEYVKMGDDIRKHLYFCPLGKIASVQLSWDVEDFCVNSDGSRILHVDHQGALYASRVVRNHLDSVLISDYVDGALQDSSATDVFYYFVGDEMYASSNGAKPEQAMSNEIDGVFVDAHTAIFFDVKEGSYTIYTRHRNRKSLVQIASGITSVD
jgi:hypothetical protein